MLFNFPIIFSKIFPSVCFTLHKVLLYFLLFSSLIINFLWCRVSVGYSRKSFMHIFFGLHCLFLFCCVWFFSFQTLLWCTDPEYIQSTYIQRAVSEQLPSAEAICYVWVLWALLCLPTHCFHHVSQVTCWTAVQLPQLALRLSVGMMPYILGAWPSWKAVNCQVWLCFSATASVYSRLQSVVIVVVSG